MKGNNGGNVPMDEHGAMSGGTRWAKKNRYTGAGSETNQIRRDEHTKEKGDLEFKKGVFSNRTKWQFPGGLMIKNRDEDHKST